MINKNNQYSGSQGTNHPMINLLSYIYIIVIIKDLKMEAIK